MSRCIRIKAGSVVMEARLNDSPTAEAIAAALPIEARVNTWGEEIYFPIPVHAQLESDASDLVREGDLAYWPTGAAFCIFFGPTPASRGNEVRAASAVNVVGTVNGDPKAFRKATDGELVILEPCG